MQTAVRKFEREIDLIFEKVYTVNESMSTFERKVLIQGFEDGLNEGLGSWLGKAFAKTKNFFTGLPDKAKDLYQKGKELASKAWNWIKDLAVKIGTAIKNGFNTAVNWVTTNFKKFTEWVSDTYNKAIEGVKSAWQKFKGKVAQFSDWCVDMWNKLVVNVKELVKKTREKLSALGAKISEWVANSWEKIKEVAEKAKNSTIEAFRKLGEWVSNALKTGLTKAGEIARGVLLVCMWPFNKLWELVKKIPALAQKLVQIITNYINSEIEDFKRAYAEEMERYRQSKLTPPTPPSTPNQDEPNVDLTLPEDDEMSDDEAARNLDEIKRKLAERQNESNSYRRSRIKGFKNFK